MSNGIIPALAGNTRTSGGPRRPSGDHPRACGEHPGDVLDASRGMGSSPRLRGTPACRLQWLLRLGIIPALAGNTDEPHQAHGWTRDHPRACGEHSTVCAPYPMEGGSSPRLRGTLNDLCGRVADAGIIPALAGNTVRARTPRRSPRDHPRACGEHICVITLRIPSGGSSPRLRGTRLLRLCGCGRVGIIPALAGNTTMAAPSPRGSWDHPRACGEHYHEL